MPKPAASTVWFTLILLVLFSTESRAATITVDSLTDGPPAVGVCSLRSAILAAETNGATGGCVAGGANDTIEFSVTGTILLTSDLPSVASPLDFIGPGADQLLINGDGQYRPFIISGSAQHTLSGMTVANTKKNTTGACIFSQVDLLKIVDMKFFQCLTDFSGGAIFASGDVEILRSEFTENEAGQDGGALVAAKIALIEDSTFDRNRAATSGGAIAKGATGQLTIRRSTFNGNIASQNGGAIATLSHTDVISSTIIGNIANAGADANYNGGGIAIPDNIPGTLTLRNNIIAGNFSGNPGTKVPDVFVAALITVNNLGFNFIGDNSSVETEYPAGQPNGSNDYAGTSATPIDPKLNPLLDFGGPNLVRTMPPLPDSPVIDQGNCPGEIADQRGISNASTGFRPQLNSVGFPGDGCDIGSVELFGDLVFKNGFEAGVIPD